MEVDAERMGIGFLLGAGVSGPPSTDDLTRIVLEGKDARRYSDGTYYISTHEPPGVSYKEKIRRIRQLLAFLRRRVDRFFRPTRKANYEDLYYLVTQLADAESEFENPALAHLLNRVKRRFLEPPLPPGTSVDPNSLLGEARQYIKGIIASKLSSLKPAENHLDQLVQAAGDPSISRLEIFTLNHDRLIESVLKRAGIDLGPGWNHPRFAENGQNAAPQIAWFGRLA